MEHYPVMLAESLEYLAIRPEGVYVDCTCGLGNHTGAIARRLTTGRVISLDRDAESLAMAAANTADCADRITFQKSAFSGLSETMRVLGVEKVDGILADLGVSRVQLTSPERGFTLMQAGPLCMRMDREQEFSAADVVNRSTERDLSQLFMELGEERRHPAEKIARALVRARPIRDTGHLADVVSSVVPRSGKLHPATRVFQAIRMAVNDEPKELNALLEQAPEWLAPGGRWVVIAFQSLDDRQVKLKFRDLGRQSRARILTKHVVRPTDAETRKNPASRSAVLRALEML
jgi:16S rRNA (cytosine1402-N4)-methyltransferase